MNESIKHTHNSENMILTLYEGFFMKKMVQICQISKKKNQKPKLPDFYNKFQ